jgi:hypothetical protein
MASLGLVPVTRAGAAHPLDGGVLNGRPADG